MEAGWRSSTGLTRSSSPSSPGSATSSSRSFSAPSAKASARTRPRDELRWPGWGKLRRFRRPDVGAADLARARQDLSRVHLELRFRESCRDQGRAVFVDRDRARDAARPGVELLFELGGEGFELDHVRDREPATRAQDPISLPDHSRLVLRELDYSVLDYDVD